jgi:lipoprotein-anchoring transpeptidase ErfK/SrfK
MRHRLFIFVAVLVAALLLGAVAVYAYDRSRDDLIVGGVRIAGIDVGGMRVAKARAAIREQLAAPLQRRVTVRYRDLRFRMSARRARLHVDVDGMVDEALERSRKGSVVSRAFRGLTGGSVEAQIPARISYSSRAVHRLVEKVSGTVDRPARDATISYSLTGFAKTPSRDGVRLRARRLERALRSELVLPAADRVVQASSKVVKPKVTTADLDSQYPYFITVDRSNFKLRFFKSLQLVKTYKIAVGRVGLETPAGLYHVQDKQIDPAWHVPNRDWAGDLAGKVIPGGRSDNPLKARWLGIYNGAGIHGTDNLSSLGSAASHGCIRMAIPDVEELYDDVPVQTPVYIA